MPPKNKIISMLLALIANALSAKTSKEKDLEDQLQEAREARSEAEQKLRDEIAKDGAALTQEEEEQLSSLLDAAQAAEPSDEAEVPYIDPP